MDGGSQSRAGSRNLNNFLAAQRWYEQAEQVNAAAGHEMWAASNLTNLGNVARSRGDLAAAQDYHRRALAMQERLAPDSLDVATSLNSLGGVALEERRFSDALPLLTRAVAIVEAQRWQIRSTEARAMLLAQYTEPYTGLLRTYLALNDLPSAFATAERARARSLLDLLAEANIDVQQGIAPELKQRERATHARIARPKTQDQRTKQTAIRNPQSAIGRWLAPSLRDF